MPVLILLGLGAAALYFFTGGHPLDAARAILDRAQAITVAVRNGDALFYPVADSRADADVTLGAPVWVYEEESDGTQAYTQLLVSAIPPPGRTDFGLSDAGSPPLEIYLPRSHFSMGEPKAS